MMATKKTNSSKPWPSVAEARKRPGQSERGEKIEVAPGRWVFRSLSSYGNDEPPLKGRAGANYADEFWKGRK